MSVSRSPAPSSIDLSGVPARVAEAVAQVVAVCHERFRSDPCPEAFEEAELRVRETMNALACELLGAVIEKRDDGASRIERDGQSWFRVAATPRTIMTSLGPLTYRRARYRSGAIGSSPVPVDESLGLVDDYLTRPAAQLGLLMMGHCTAREAAAFFAKIGGMTPSVSTLQRLTRTMHERWETLGPETLDSIRDAEGVPHEAVSASVSLDGVMVPLRAGEDGRAEASWREAACGTVSFHDAKGHTTSWIGYKLHVDTADGGIPIGCIMTSASTHDSQVAIPLGTLTAGRVENLYDLMDAAYDSIEIWAHSILLGHKPIIDVNPRRSVEMQEALKREKKARRTLGLVFPEERRYVVRSGSERINGRLKDEFGGRHVRVRGYDKVLAHLMFGMTVLTASQLMRLIVPPI